MKPQQYAVYLVAKPFKVADVYEKGCLNGIFIKGFNASIGHSLSSY